MVTFRQFFFRSSPHRRYLIFHGLQYFVTKDLVCNWLGESSRLQFCDQAQCTWRHILSLLLVMGHFCFVWIENESFFFKCLSRCFLLQLTCEKIKHLSWFEKEFKGVLCAPNWLWKGKHVDLPTLVLASFCQSWQILEFPCHVWPFAFFSGCSASSCIRRLFFLRAAMLYSWLWCPPVSWVPLEAS